ncbi:hypothetical protein Ddye_017638 [Dipteronia dyeriana]|uniref:Uncharacterized protein n=1 Tax=Dipteronia dyeriana TaxID=168575 RepID=A0AAD9U9Y2_9ROSI|nr:hypothetical protein Ddye_017638 [Dipteronia dyeriana]
MWQLFKERILVWSVLRNFGLCHSSSRKRMWNALFCVVAWTIWESQNKVVFNGEEAIVCLALDSIKFRAVWCFKHLGEGSNDDVSLLLLDVKERYVDKILAKSSKNVYWTPPANDDLFFNVNGSTRGNPGAAGIGRVLRDANGNILC